MGRLRTRLHSGFFWGAPSHKPIAWAGAISGVGVMALALFLFALGHGAPLFLLALLLLGLANLGWAAELLPKGQTAVAGWARVCRWGSALVGTGLAILCLVWGMAFGLAFGAVIAGMGLFQVFEFAPRGPANRP